MEKATVNTVIKWIKQNPRKIGMVTAPLGGGKTTTALETGVKISSQKLNVVLLAPSWRRLKLESKVEDMNLPLTSNFVIETPQSCALRILGSKFAIVDNINDQVNRRVLHSRIDIASFLLPRLSKFPVGQYRPVVSSSQYLYKLVDFFVALERAGLAGGKWDCNKLLGNSESWKDLCVFFETYDKLIEQSNATTFPRLMSKACDLLEKNLTESNFDLETAQSIWDSPCDVLLIDDCHLFTPVELKLVSRMAQCPRKSTVLFADGSEGSLDFWRPNYVSAKPVEYLKTATRADCIFDVDANSQKRNPIELFVDGRNELESIKNWINSRDVDGEDLFISSNSSSVNDELSAGLMTYLDKDAFYIHFQAGRDTLFQSDVVRGLHFLLRAVATGKRDTADRELFYVLTSKYFPYQAKPFELQVLGDNRIRAHLDMRESMNKIESGKRLLSDLSILEASFQNGYSASKLALDALRLTGIARLVSSLSDTEASHAEYLSTYMNLLLSIEGQFLKENPAPALIWDVLRIAETTPANSVVNEMGEDKVLGAYRSSGRRIVHLMSFEKLSREYEPGGIKHLCLAGCNAKLLPSSFRRSHYGLPWKVLNSLEEPRLNAATHQEDRDNHIELERRLLRSVIARGKPGETVTVTYDNNETLSPLIHEYLESQSKQVHLQSTNETSPAAAEKAKGKSTRKKRLGERHMSSLSASNQNDDFLPLSYSRIFEYLTCPKRYHYSRVLGLRTPSNARMVFGKAVHAGVEGFLLASSNHDRLQAAQKAFLKTFEEQFSDVCQPLPEDFLSKEHIEEVKQLGLNVIDAFCARWERNSQDRVISAEQRFDLVWQPARVNVVGVIDLVERNIKSGKVCIVDFKTNTLDSAKLRRISRGSIQLDVYAWAYYKLFGEQVDLVAIESLETGERFYRTPASFDHVEEILQKVSENILEGNFKASPGFASCKFCAFRQICDESTSRSLY